jgi:hypothetical protein
LQSTGHSEDEDPLEKKRRRRKLKENDLVTSEEGVSRRLEGLVIRESERGVCAVSEEWRAKMAARKARYLSS